MVPVLETLVGRRDVGEDVKERDVVAVDTATELVVRRDVVDVAVWAGVGVADALGTEEDAGDRAEFDVDDLVAETTAVRETGVVTGDHAVGIRALRRRDRHVEAEHL